MVRQNGQDGVWYVICVWTFVCAGSSRVQLHVILETQTGRNDGYPFALRSSHRGHSILPKSWYAC